jgi:hypothetical protein
VLRFLASQPLARTSTLFSTLYSSSSSFSPFSLSAGANASTQTRWAAMIANLRISSAPWFVSLSWK